ncbi:hypothetical protein N7470_008379 [Penicillium chermesinum]|nr:hypothetical protein N7470_008379 [Penicillium chermesinum]
MENYSSVTRAEQVSRRQARILASLRLLGLGASESLIPVPVSDFLSLPLHLISFIGFMTITSGPYS